MKDKDIKYTKDAPRTRPEDWVNAVFYRGGFPRPLPKVQIALRVDADVLEWFKAQGEGYQTRMNLVLREFRNAHLSSNKSTSAR